MKKKFLISLFLTITILTAIFSTVYAIDEQTEIPSKYDLRNDINIGVENQIELTKEEYHDGPSCTHYTCMKMIETFIQKAKGINYNLSETYYAYQRTNTSCIGK